MAPPRIIRELCAAVGGPITLDPDKIRWGHGKLILSHLPATAPLPSSTSSCDINWTGRSIGGSQLILYAKLPSLLPITLVPAFRIPLLRWPEKKGPSESIQLRPLQSAPHAPYPFQASWDPSQHASTSPSTVSLHTRALHGNSYRIPGRRRPTTRLPMPSTTADICRLRNDHDGRWTACSPCPPQTSTGLRI